MRIVNKFFSLIKVAELYWFCSDRIQWPVSAVLVTVNQLSEDSVGLMLKTTIFVTWPHLKNVVATKGAEYGK